MGRSKFIKTAKPQNEIPYNEFVDRIRKTLYYGADTREAEIHISHPLANYTSDLFSEPHKGRSLNHLHTVTVGRTQATPCSLIMALIYLDRLNVIAPEFVRRIAPNDLFAVALVIATKFNGCIDYPVNVVQIATDANTSTERINELEWDFLNAIEWQVYVSNQEFYRKLYNVERTIGVKEGSRRGTFTYTELAEVLPSIALVKFILNSVTILAVSYAASVITIAGAFLVASQIPGTIWYRRSIVQAPTENVTVPTTDLMPHATELLTSAQEGSLNYANNQSNQSSCLGLDIEAELLKLEQQYCDEATKHKINRHIETALPLLEHLVYGNHQHSYAVANKPNTWLSFKSDYSDLHPIMLRRSQTKPPPAHMNTSLLPVWELMYIAVQQTVELVLPDSWVKYI